MLICFPCSVPVGFLSKRQLCFTVSLLAVSFFLFFSIFGVACAFVLQSPHSVPLFVLSFCFVLFFGASAFFAISFLVSVFSTWSLFPPGALFLLPPSMRESSVRVVEIVHPPPLQLFPLETYLHCFLGFFVPTVSLASVFLFDDV